MTVTVSLPPRTGESITDIEAAAAAALAAIEAAGLVYTRAEAVAATIASSVNILRTSGFATAGDGGDALYQRFGGTLSAAGFVDASGAKWEFVGDVGRPEIMGGGFGDDAADLAALSYLFGTATCGVVELSNKTYDIGSGTLTVSRSNFQVSGVPGSTTITTSAKKLLVFGSVSDIVIDDIDFVSTHVSSVEDFYAGVIWWPRVTSRRITFNRCSVDNATSYACSIQAVCQSGSELTESIYFYDCRILNSGFFGLAIDNTNTDTVSRNFDWKWIGGSIKNTGLVSPEYGQGISVSGFMDGFEVDTVFDNNKTIGFEGSGVCGLRLSGTLTNLRDTVSGNGARAPIALTNNDANLNLSRKMTDNRVENFTAIDGTGGEVRFWFQDGLKTSGNSFVLNPSVDGLGSVTYAGSTNCVSVGDTYDCAGNFVLELRREDTAANPQGGVTANNRWDALTVDHSRAATPSYLVLCVGEGVDNNIINGMGYTPDSANESLIGSGSETTLTASIASGPNVLTVTAQSGYSLIRPGVSGVGQRLYWPGMTITPPTITAQLTGTTGGVGTYSYDGVGATVASGSVTAGRASKNFVRGTARRNDGFDMVQRSYQMASDADVNLNLVDTAPSLLSANSLVITSAGSLTATRTIYLPIGFEAIAVTNSTTGGQSLNFVGAEGGSNFSIPNGVTATIGSTSSGIVRLSSPAPLTATATYNPPSLALGASDTIQTMTLTGAVMGDIVAMSFSVDLAGAVIKGWVSAANTVSYYFTNENGANPLDLGSGTVRAVIRR